MTDFNRKNVFITGGSSGIGLSAATQLSKLGANIGIFSRSQEKLEHAAKEIKGTRKNSGSRVLYWPLDVSDNTMTKDVMAQAVSKMGPPDILINSAGRSSPNYFENITFDQFAETLNINLFGTRNTIAALLPHMKEKGGHIINVSSVAGFIGVFGFTDYCASKFGMIGFSEALRSECKKYGVLVSVLCPPDTDTPMLAAENVNKPPETKAVSETGGLLTADYVAETMIKGIGKKSFMIIPGFMGKLTFMAKRLFPGVVEAVMDRDIKKVQNR